MITEEKIKIFNRYNGNIDEWVRNNKKKEKSIMEDKDWYLITSFLQDLSLIKKGLTSSDYAQKFHSQLIENCDNQKTIDELKKLVK